MTNWDFHTKREDLPEVLAAKAKVVADLLRIGKGAGQLEDLLFEASLETQQTSLSKPKPKPRPEKGALQTRR